MTTAIAQPPDIREIRIRSARGTIVVRPAPRREPPFDDELPEQAGRATYDRPLPFERPRRRLPVQAAPPPSRAATVPDPASGDADCWSGSSRRRAEDGP